MTESDAVVFEDQTQRRRKLQLHEVDGLFRVNLTVALANYDAVSFTRLSDGLVLEHYGASDYSAASFKPGEEVVVEAVRRSTGHSHEIVKALLEELDQRNLTGNLTADAIAKHLVAELGPRPDERLGHLLRPQYTDADVAQPMQHDTGETPQVATPVDITGAGPHTDSLAQQQAVAAGQLGPMQLAMTPAAATPQPISEYNASGKKRRFCGACQNHNVKTPVTFQHQQQCQWRNCPCNLCVKKRNISQAQAAKRHAAKAASQGGMSDSQQQVDGSGQQQEVQQQEMQQALPPQPAAPPSPAQITMPLGEQTA